MFFSQNELHLQILHITKPLRYISNAYLSSCAEYCPFKWNGMSGSITFTLSYAHHSHAKTCFFLFRLSVKLAWRSKINRNINESGFGVTAIIIKEGQYGLKSLAEPNKRQKWNWLILLCFFHYFHVFLWMFVVEGKNGKTYKANVTHIPVYCRFMFCLMPLSTFQTFRIDNPLVCYNVGEKVQFPYLLHYFYIDNFSIFNVFIFFIFFIFPTCLLYFNFWFHVIFDCRLTRNS